MSRSSIAPFAVSKLFRGSSQGSDLLVGRENELKALDAAWSGSERKNIVTIVAWGGVGKTSLVARWAANTLANVDHAGVERYFDWSFYSQGTRTEGDATGADKAASADIFVKEALEFFGDPDLAVNNAGAWQKGERLARLIAEQRTLLILDGLEPLQDAKSGELHDEALRALLRGLAANNHGLCVVTTRQQLPELNNWHSTTAPEWQLAKLSKEAGADLLKKLGVQGTPAEREQLAADLKGHALSITLLGKYLVEAHGGDIRKRDLVSLTEADYEETSGHAYQVIEAYERWLEKDGLERELTILRLLGFVDRPATPDCLFALRQGPAIAGLTEALTSLTDTQWNIAVKRLAKLGLVEEQPWEPRQVLGFSKEVAQKANDGGDLFPLSQLQLSSINVQSSILNSIDAHPLIRECFGRRLRETSQEAWRTAHSRLFEHLRSSVPYWPEGLHGLQPLYHSVVHGCQAGRFQETCEEIFHDRILRGSHGSQAFYAEVKLGAIGANLAAVTCFFAVPWSQPAPELEEHIRAWLLNAAARYLRALGRLTEARDPFRASTNLAAKHKAWGNAATGTSTLSELHLTLGEVAPAVREAEQAVSFAFQTNDALRRVCTIATHADALHQAGQKEKARTRFAEAEAMQREYTPAHPLLYSGWGFSFCDLLLAETEREAWRALLEVAASSHLFKLNLTLFARLEGVVKQQSFRSLHLVEQRAKETLMAAEHNNLLLDIALDRLTLGRSALYHAILEPSSFDANNSALSSHLDAAVHGLRQAGKSDHLPRGFLSHAWLRAVQGQAAETRSDLDEAQQIAERGPMRLHLADVHLHRARLFFRDDLAAAREGLKQARTLIEKCGYLRRMPELEDAEKVILAVK